jgi:transposase InsO family protein
MRLRCRQPRLGGKKVYFIIGEELKKIKVSRDKLFDILRSKGLLVEPKRKYAITTNSNHQLRLHPDLIKGVRPVRPEQICVADITFLRLKEGFCYLHLVTDAYSKKIMGYELSLSLKTEYTMRALAMAIEQRQTRRKMIHHSDRGGQYCNDKYVGTLTKNRIRVSMTQDGNPYDNAVAERVNGILKSEFALDATFSNLIEARKAVVEAIYIYNHERPHMSCSMLTPVQMHNQSTLEVKAWPKKISKKIFN